MKTLAEQLGDVHRQQRQARRRKPNAGSTRRWPRHEPLPGQVGQTHHVAEQGHCQQPQIRTGTVDRDGSLGRQPERDEQEARCRGQEHQEDRSVGDSHAGAQGQLAGPAADLPPLQ